MFSLPYIATMIKRLLLVLFIMALTRMLLMFLNPGLFPGISVATGISLFFQGLRFDLVATVYLNSVYIIMQSVPLRIRENKVWQKTADSWFIVANSVGFIPNLADSVYYRFTMKRLTGDIFSYISLGDDTIRLLPQFAADFWYVFLLWVILVALVFLITWQIKPRERQTSQHNARWYIWNLLTMLLIGGFSVLAMRGGIQLKPIGILTATEMAGQQNAPLVNNSAFSIMRTLNQKGLDNKAYFSNASEMVDYFNAEHNYSRKSSDGSIVPMHTKNVVIIILESFSCEHINAFNPENGRGGFTPFLDSLITRSLTFKAYANGKRSIEGIPAVLAGIPAWMPQDFITSVYSGNKINSLASLLNTKGYTTSFFHGGKNGTMGFDAFCRSAGFMKYYGKNEYPDPLDFDGDWGIWDEPFLQFFASELNKMPKPFLSAVFTLSSHHPYKIPEKYTGKFRQGKLPIQQSIMYADYALEQFFKSASGSDWFLNTVFVITADHTSEAVNPYYENRLGQYAVPIIIFDPQNPLPAFNTLIAQQTDILPTIMDMLAYNEPFIAFGNSLIHPEEAHFSLSYLSGSYQFITSDGVLQWQNDKPVAYYSLPSDSLLRENLYPAKSGDLTRNINLLKSVVQQYNSRMIANRLTVN